MSVLQILCSASPNFLFPRLDFILFFFPVQTPVPPTHGQTCISRSSDPRLLHPLHLLWPLLFPGCHRTHFGTPVLNDQSTLCLWMAGRSLPECVSSTPAPSDWKRKHAHFGARSCPSAEIYRLGKITSPSLSVALVPALDRSISALFSLPTPAHWVLSCPSFKTSFKKTFFLDKRDLLNRKDLKQKPQQPDFQHGIVTSPLCMVMRLR